MTANNPAITAHLPYKLPIPYLTLSDYRSYSRVSKLFHRLSIEILQNEAVYFGGKKDNCLEYLKGLCSTIKESDFPLQVTRTKKTRFGHEIEKLDIRATLLKIRSISLAEYHDLFNLDKLPSIYPLICLSPLPLGDLPSIACSGLLVNSAYHGRIKIMERLLQLGIFPTNPPNALIAAINERKVDAVNMLLPHTKNINYISLLGGHGSLLYIAAKSVIKARAEHQSALDFLETTRKYLTAEQNELCNVELRAKVQNLENQVLASETIIKILVANGAMDVNQSNSVLPFPSAFYYALKTGNFDLAQFLKSLGIGLSSLGVGKMNYLHMAMFFRQDWMLDNLQDYSSLINAQDQGGRTPLHFAMSQQYAVGIRFLLINGARLDIRAKSGQTPIELFPKYLELVKLEKLP